MTGHLTAEDLTAEDLTAELRGAVPDPGWLADALATVAATPGSIGVLFPAVGRHCGRGALPGARGEFRDWTVDDAVRVLLLVTVKEKSQRDLPQEITALYRYGDAAEKRGVLRALPWLGIGDAAVGLLHDAIRTNDPRLVAAALGPYAGHLDDAMWRQGVLKCVFMEIPLTAVAGLGERADGELARMLAGLAEERHAAGRTIPADATALLARLTGNEREAG